MKGLVLGIVILTLILSEGFASPGYFTGFKVKRYPYYIYSDGTSRINHFHPSNWTGQFWNLKLNYNYSINPASGDTCIQLIYQKDAKAANVSAGLSFSIQPVNRWNTVRGGDDLVTAKKMYFYARGERGNERINVKVKSLNVKPPQRAVIQMSLVLGKEWKLYEFDVSSVNTAWFDDKIDGVSIVFPGDDESNNYTIYLDHIYLVDTAAPMDISN